MRAPLEVYRGPGWCVVCYYILLGLEVDVIGGWALFGLDLEREAGMVWELACNFPVGAGMFAMLWWDRGYGFSSTLSVVQSAASVGCACGTGLRLCVGRTAMAQAMLAGCICQGNLEEKRLPFRKNLSGVSLSEKMWADPGLCWVF